MHVSKIYTFENKQGHPNCIDDFFCWHRWHSTINRNLDRAVESTFIRYSTSHNPWRIHGTGIFDLHECLTFMVNVGKHKYTIRGFGWSYVLLTRDYNGFNISIWLSSVIPKINICKGLFIFSKRNISSCTLLETYISPTSRHFWVDDFPNFPFGGICDCSVGEYVQQSAMNPGYMLPWLKWNWGEHSPSLALKPVDMKAHRNTHMYKYTYDTNLFEHMWKWVHRKTNIC